MAIASLIPNSTTDTNANISSGTHTNIDEDIDGAGDSSYVTSIANAWTGTPANFTFGLTNVPADFASANTARIRVKAHIPSTANSNDTISYVCSVSGTNAPTNFVQWTNSENGNGLTTKSATSQSVSAASSTNINGWIVDIEQTAFSQSMSPDGAQFQIEAIEVELDYNPITYADIQVIGYHRSKNFGCQ